jgi:hypothetical protein
MSSDTKEDGNRDGFAGDRRYTLVAVRSREVTTAIIKGPPLRSQWAILKVGAMISLNVKLVIYSIIL